MSQYTMTGGVLANNQAVSNCMGGDNSYYAEGNADYCGGGAIFLRDGHVACVCALNVASRSPLRSLSLSLTCSSLHCWIRSPL